MTGVATADPEVDAVVSPSPPRSVPRFWRILLLIALGALVLRWGLVVTAKTDLLVSIGLANTECVMPGTTPVEPVPEHCDEPPMGDAIYYAAQAIMIADGRWFEHPFSGEEAADHAPLTAVVMAPAALVGGSDPLFEQRLLMSLYGTAVVIVIGLVGRRVAGERAGLVAAGIAAVQPNLWMNDLIVMSETLAALGVATILLTLYRFRDRPTVVRAAEVGLACGVTVLARAELGMLLPLVMGPMCWWARDLLPWARVGRFVTAGVVAVAVASPWTLYNLTRFEEPVLFSTNDGLTLIGANCDSVYDDASLGFWNLNCAFAVPVDPALDQSQESKIWRDAAVDYILEHTDRLPAVVASRLGRAWGIIHPDQMVYLNQGEGRERWASWAGVLAWWATVPFAVGGAVVLRRREVPIWPFVGLVMAVTFTAAAFYGLARFRVPVEVGAVVLAGVAIDALLERSRRAADDRARPVAPDVAPEPAAGPDPVDTPGLGQATPVPELSGGAHFPCLDAYRGLGMTMVLVIHAAFATGFDKRSPGLGRYLARLDFGLPMFFVLSGFLLYRPFVRALLADRRPTPTLRFYRRRALRIFPGYWAALALLALFLGSTLVAGLDPADWFANVFLLQGVGVDAPYAITQAWSIGVEATFYLVLPLYAWACTRLLADRSPGARLRWLAAGVAGWYAVGAGFRLLVVAADPTWAGQSLLWLPMYADIFAVGMAFAVVSASADLGRPLPRAVATLARHPALCWLMAFGIWVLVAQMEPPEVPFSITGREYVPRQFGYGLAAGFWLLPAMFGDQSEGRIRAFLRARPMVYLGMVSYSFYLFHLAFVEKAKEWTIPGYDQLEGLSTFRGNVAVVAGIAFVASLAVASVLYRAVELPFLRLKDEPFWSVGRRLRHRRRPLRSDPPPVESPA